jgi:tripartite-type tricarboxylate transporter receptor subunit TctC
MTAEQSSLTAIRYDGVSRMEMRIRSGVAALLMSFALLCAPAPSSAQDYPSRPIRLIVPYAAGTSTDLVARQISEKLADVLGQRFTIENKVGAGGSLGTSVAAKSAPDGYTLVLGTGQTHAVNVSLYKNLGYNPVADFAPVSRIGSQPLVLVAHPSLSVQKVDELTALAKAKPGGLSYASTGSGTSPHLAGATFAMLTGLNLVHVPYNNQLFFPDLLSGRVSLMFYPYPALKGYIETRQLTALATTGAARSPWLAALPTMAEAGYPTFVFAPWYALYAPAGTPTAITEKLARAVERVLADPGTKARLEDSGTYIEFAAPAELATFTAQEIARFAPIVAASGARAE